MFSFLSGMFVRLLLIEIVTKMILLFISEKFRFEASVTDDSNESFTSDDKISIISLLLYYSCVVKVSQFFQECCKSLSTEDQSYIFTFFGVIKQAYENNEPVTQHIIAQAIQKAVPASPQFKFLSSSPMKTPDKFSPSNTPAKRISHEKLMKLKFLKTQLENERYERNLVETELKESEEIIARLRKFEINLPL